MAGAKASDRHRSVLRHARGLQPYSVVWPASVRFWSLGSSGSKPWFLILVSDFPVIRVFALSSLFWFFFLSELVLVFEPFFCNHLKRVLFLDQLPLPRLQAGKTPLACAQEKGHVAVVELLQ
jgi:hypothetical protein